jgi:hypothetical protein
MTPGEGSFVTGTVTVAVSTSDDTGVVKVSLFVDGVLQSSNVNSPFTVKWSTRKTMAGGHTLQARAYDAAGNVGASSLVTVYK